MRCRPTKTGPGSCRLLKCILVDFLSKEDSMKNATVREGRGSSSAIKVLLCMTLSFCCVCASYGDDDQKKEEKPPTENSSVTGDIKITDGYPKSHALTTKRKKGEKEVELPIASVNVTWAVEAPCPCDKVEIKQEIKGYVEVVDPDGSKTTLTTKDIVEMAISGVPDAKGSEAYDVRHGKENSKTEFIHDVGRNGSSTYPKNQIQCKKVDDKKSQAEFVDEPVTNAVVGADAPLYKEFNIRLTFRTIILCDKKEIGSFVWHIKYDLPESADRPKEVALGELK